MNTFYLKLYSKPIDGYTGFFNQTPFYFYLSTSNTTLQDYNLNLYSQNSNSAPYQIPQTKWAHLLPQWGFYNSSGEYVEKCTTWAASSISANGSILPISSYSSLSSTGNFSGLIYLASAYYVDSLPTTATLIATLETSGFSISSDNVEANIAGYSNSLIFSEVNYTIKAPPVCSISITQDGKNPIDKFKWSTIPVPYVITLHTNNNNTTYNSNQYGLTSINPIMFWFPSANIISSTNLVNRTVNGINSVIWENKTNSFYLSAKDKYGFNIGGFYKGYFTTSSNYLSTYISATVGTLSANSNTFNIKLFQTPYELRRFNESWDITNVMRSYALAEITYNNDELFKFLNNSIGGLSANYQSIGRQFYEKIGNFVKNQADVDISNINQTYSIAKELDVPMDDYRISYPSELRRIMDIISVNHDVLWGETCKCNRHFYGVEVCPRCNHSHSLNRSINKIEPLQYKVSAQVPFVIENTYALNDYTRYDLIYPSLSDTFGNSEYALSALPSVSWLLSSKYFKYYIYEYIPTTCNVHNEGVINWSDDYTTLQYSASTLNEWYGKNGIIEEMLNYELHRGLYSV